MNNKNVKDDVITYDEKKKKRLRRGLRNNKVMLGITALALIACVIYGVIQTKRADRYRTQLDNQYNRSFFELVGYVNNIDAFLLKSMVTSTPERTSNLLEEAWRYATLAQSNLSQLPIQHETLSNTSKFLVQLGDFSYMLVSKQAAGEEITDEQYKQLEKFQKYSNDLNKTLGIMMDDLTDGRMRWKELEKEGEHFMRQASKEVKPAPGIENLQKSFMEYPTLIYDGPFSDHMSETEPKGLGGKVVDQSKGEEILRNIFGKDNIKEIKFNGRNDASKIKTLSYTVTTKDKNGKDNGSIDVDITQRGGHLYWMLKNRNIGEKKLSVEEAKEATSKFLENLGVKDMQDSYYTHDDGTATINYIYKKDDVVFYPDMVKVKVALDIGEVVGYEAKNYLNNHTERKDLEPKISEAEALKEVSPRVKVGSVGLAVIPTDFNTEIFTYEIKGKAGEKDVIIYINAENAREEKVLIIIDSENGILTM